MGCSFYRRERNYLSATDAWREAAVGDPPHICIRTASFECSVSKQMVVKTDQPGDRHPQTKTRSALGNRLIFPDDRDRLASRPLGPLRARRRHRAPGLDETGQSKRLHVLFILENNPASNGGVSFWRPPSISCSKKRLK